MRLARTIEELRRETVALRQQHGLLSLVPTMGALHAGHLALVERAGAGGAGVVASIFVNPRQFGANEDLARYPRDEPGDLQKLESAGCDLVWLPEVDTMYPPGDATTITVAGPSEGFEGAARPGHFTGVATVVAKLFGQTGADRACFGAKDWQQAQVIRRMVRDLSLPVAIEIVPTVREPDGLAMSSRNRFLTPAERAVAPLLHGALQGAAEQIGRGLDATTACADAADFLRTRGFTPEYLTLVDAESLRPLDRPGPQNRLLAAARLGGVRLLDNIEA